MFKPTEDHVIRLRGVRHNNLKGFDLELPTGKLIVVTGLSGSGKSSLAFDTLYAEGQRRYIETFSPYARQFFDRMDKPRVDGIEGIPPAIAIEQRNTVRSTRSTVGTLTEICDHMKVLWPHIAQLHCRRCGQPVRKESPQRVWEALNAECGTRNAECLVAFDVALSQKLSIEESLALIAKQGYQRILVDGEIVRLDDPTVRSAFRAPRSALTVVQDRLRLTTARRTRFIEACEQAYHFGKGKLAIHLLDSSVPRSAIPDPRRFSARLHCATCDLDYQDPSPALFSFNHPVGACPACKGFGRIITIDYDLAIPDRRRTLKEGAVKPWQSGMSAECQRDLLRFCRAMRVPVDVPFQDLSREHQDWIIQGDPDYGTDEDHEWPRAWYGVKGYFRWLESKAYKMHVRVLLSRYRAYTRCPDCAGARLQPDALLYRLPLTRGTGRRVSRPAIPATIPGSSHSHLSLADFYALPIRSSLGIITDLLAGKQDQPVPTSLRPTFEEVHSRLRYLDAIGLAYLTLDRATRTLSGGETERVNLAACLGTRLVNTLFVLDEPSVGLHPRDTDRLVGILESLRDEGNTVVVVEHERSVMEAADRIVDLGPGHGLTGGQLVFQGSYAQILRAKASLTGHYLCGRSAIEIPERRTVQNPKSERRSPDWITVANAVHHNLKHLNVEIPLNRLVCVSGVSGSGKSTLVRDVLLPGLRRHLGATADPAKASDRMDDSAATDDLATRDSAPTPTRVTGAEHLAEVVLVDQSILAKTPRSNPAVYTGAFDHIRELFAQSEGARRQGLKASAFSFNSPQGQCERCRGAGFEKVEMQFLSDVFIRCPDCNGRRYREHILEVRLQIADCRSRKRRQMRKESSPKARSRDTQHEARSLSIADVLESTVDEAVMFLAAFSDSTPARRAVAALTLLQEVGLGYLQVGQPINTLSGGESQRLKLVRHLAEAEASSPTEARKPKRETEASALPGRRSDLGSRSSAPKRVLFLLDEPTTGLHFDDVRVLLKALQRLVDAGHSLVIIEHNLDVLKCADWIIDLGPEAGEQGGHVVVAGTPETVAACTASHTGRFLRTILSHKARRQRKASQAVVTGSTAPKGGRRK